ncbi:MAG: HAMP domain-containing histidine kinase [Chitinophagaceae bacterium]|nr:HAMP domain-containing histidine kinase [Chitinophagaceae bacterium]
MKKIFPVITILILLSLLGLIFFQWLWIKGAMDTKEKQFEDEIILATSKAAMSLMEEKGNLVPSPKRNDFLFPSDKFQFDFFKSTISQKFSKDEIANIIRKAFNSRGLKSIPFEFAITSGSAFADEVISTNFIKYYNDSIDNRNIRHFFPLESPSGSASENLTQTEWLCIIVPNVNNLVFQQMGWFIIGAIIFTLIITAAFFITIRTLLKQKKLSEIKSDFINNMTHEFKTPLATISLAVDALKNEKVIADKSKMDYFTAIIKEENKRMNKQVEAILQAALLDKQKVQLNLKKIPAHELITSALNNIKLQVEEKSGQLEINLNAAKDLIEADEVHFTNLINNLLDNAVKYSKGNLKIKLTTQNIGNQIKIKITDNGIGMNKETVSRIFEKFYRAHTGNIHNVKGFGLGLSYVKTMVDAHHGTIKAESVLGKGSTFTIHMPLTS